MEGLPTELLERVLRSLAPADLVTARAVCVRWRTAVAALEAHDRRFCFRCGAPDVLAVPQETYNTDEFERAALACTCGVVVRHDLRAMVLGDKARNWWENDASVPAQLSDPYRIRHGDAPRWPPARWEVLACERALALTMTSLSVRLATDVQSWEFVIEDRYFSCTYVPSWVYLPPDLLRPRTVPALRALVNAVFGYDVAAARATVARLAASPAAARAFYTDADAAWAREYCQRALEVLRTHADDTAAFSARRDRFAATYPNGLAIVAAHTAMQSEVERQLDTGTSQRYAQRHALVQQYPESAAISQAYAALTEAFEAEACRAPLITDADWHDVWSVDALVADGAAAPAADDDNDDDDDDDDNKGAGRVYEPDNFSGVVDDLRRDTDDRRPAPFRWGTSERIELSDPSGWSTWQWHARTTAAAIRRCLLKRWRDKVVEHFDCRRRQLPPNRDCWAACADADLLAVGDRAVATVDAVKASFAACCTLPVVVDVGECECVYWVGGLSPAGHLVGTMTTHYRK